MPDLPPVVIYCASPAPVVAGLPPPVRSRPMPPQPSPAPAPASGPKAWLWDTSRPGWQALGRLDGTRIVDVDGWRFVPAAPPPTLTVYGQSCPNGMCPGR